MAEPREPTLGEIVEREYIRFRLHHAELGTVDTPTGFAARFRAHLEPHLEQWSSEVRAAVPDVDHAELGDRPCPSCDTDAARLQMLLEHT